MNKRADTVVHIRISKREQAVIDAEQKRIEQANPGTRISRGEAARSLILRGAAARKATEAEVRG